MNVLIVGATGYVGAAVARAVASMGHRVYGTARSPEAARKLQANRVKPVDADVRDPQSLVNAARAMDAVIYAVQYNGDDQFETESAALRALAELASEGRKTLIYTSGVWLYGATGERAADESSPANPIALVRHRPALEAIVLESAQRGARAIVIRPGIVYGHAGGIPAMWSTTAGEGGAARVIGDGKNRWPLVHVDDLARLYVLALQRAQAGAIYNAADDSAFSVREMAEAASRGAGANGKLEFVTLDVAREAMGSFADALALDQRISSRKAREELGWEPHAKSIVEELTAGTYA